MDALNGVVVMAGIEPKRFFGAIIAILIVVGPVYIIVVVVVVVVAGLLLLLPLTLPSKEPCAIAIVVVGVVFRRCDGMWMCVGVWL